MSQGTRRSSPPDHLTVGGRLRRRDHLLVHRHEAPPRQVRGVQRTDSHQRGDAQGLDPERVPDHRGDGLAEAAGVDGRLDEDPCGPRHDVVQVGVLRDGDARDAVGRCLQHVPPMPRAFDSGDDHRGLGPHGVAFGSAQSGAVIDPVSHPQFVSDPAQARQPCRRQPRSHHQSCRRPHRHRGDQGIQAAVARQADDIAGGLGTGVDVGDGHGHWEGPGRQRGDPATAPALMLGARERDHGIDKSGHLLLQRRAGRTLVEGGHNRGASACLDRRHRRGDAQCVDDVGGPVDPALAQLEGTGSERRVDVAAGDSPHILDHDCAGGAKAVSDERDTAAWDVGDVGEWTGDQVNQHR